MCIGVYNKLDQVKLVFTCLLMFTCSEGFVQVSGWSSVPPLAEFGSELIVSRLLIIQNLKRLKKPKDGKIQTDKKLIIVELSHMHTTQM